ncbi:MAG: LamG-like jellyroll fold domain-containing protein, partial [Casimicrobiaceae bacterium]
TGNVVLDRDIYGPGPDWGVALGARSAGGMHVAFGASDASGDGTVVCGTSDVADGAWHHIAVQRRLTDGRIWLFVDGRLEASAIGPAGTLAYPDHRLTSYPASDPYLVLAAEKHDAGAGYPSFSGWLSELRLSTVLRYPTGTTLGPAFAVHDRRHAVDAHTAALYRFQEGSGLALRSATGDAAVTGAVMFHPTLARPQWSTDAPLLRSPGCLDIDDDGVVAASTDGLLLLRAWLGLRGPALTAGALGGVARRTDPAAILAYLATQPLDLPTLPGREASRTGIALVRLMSGVGDAELLTGLVASAAPASVRSEVAAGCGLP